MSLKYGLNIKKKAPVPTRRAVFDDDDDDDGEDEIAPPGVVETFIEEIGTFDKSAPLKPLPSRQQEKPKGAPKKSESNARQDLSALQASQAQVKAAEEVDASIFDYDSFLDAKSSVTEAKKAAAKQDAIERKPKYINNLLDAAARRKQDQQVAKEKMLQKEREAEGDEFADKEKFVTGAYKQQQEENRRLEVEEKKKAEEEERRKRQQGGGMQGFYRTMIEQQDKQHQEAIEAAAKAEKEGIKTSSAEGRKTDAELAAELQAKGVRVHLNDEGQITDKRELLTAGLNVVTSGKSSTDSSSADHLRTSNRPRDSAFERRTHGNQQAQRERQSRMIEEQMAERAKRAREEEEEERARLEKAAKSTKSDKDVSDARARYLARKAAKERGEG